MEEIASMDLIELPHYNNTVTIEYNGIHYEDPFQNKFVYRLHNYEKEWRKRLGKDLLIHSPIPLR